MPDAPAIYWHRQDLRLADNPALQWAAQRGPVIPVYIYDKDLSKNWPMGGASKWWLHFALEDLAKDYRTLDIDLIFRAGKILPSLLQLLEDTQAKFITWTRCFEPYWIAHDELIIKKLQSLNIEFSVHNSSLLHDPNTVLNQSGEGYKVFTPFSRACFSKKVLPPIARPTQLRGIKNIANENVNDWKLRPTKPDWAHGLKSTWKVGEKSGQNVLDAFVDQSLSSYNVGRNRPDQDTTSRLSPYLHFGHISPKQIWRAVQLAMAQNSLIASHAETYLREILWREFSYHTLSRHAAFAESPLNKSFENFPFVTNKKHLSAWQKGQTGFPIVDAGMRQLWQTGWMHNRVRMIVGSFLVKDLLISWREGARWFWDTLVDADLANNSSGWQWISGCGVDAAPYFRIFNPILQAKKFDPNGEYIRRYIPELKKLDTLYIHEPWQAPREILLEANIKLGTTYPLPIVDHTEARREALIALSNMNNTNHASHPSRSSNDKSEL